MWVVLLLYWAHSWSLATLNHLCTVCCVEQLCLWLVASFALEPLSTIKKLECRLTVMTCAPKSFIAIAASRVLAGARARASSRFGDSQQQQRSGPLRTRR